MKFDQHFLNDKSIAKIMAKGISKKDTVIEIGPGKGIVTKLIPECNFTAVEIDPELVKQLKKDFPEKNISEGEGVSFLKKRKFGILVSSVPYSISEPLIRELLLHDFKKAMLILPEKFAKRLFDEKSKLGFVASSLLEVQIIKKIPKTSFSPPPRASSVLAEITPGEKDSLVKELYRQQDKKLKNAIITFLGRKGLTKNQAREICKKIPKKTLEKNIKYLSVAEWKKAKNAVGKKAD